MIRFNFVLLGVLIAGSAQGFDPSQQDDSRALVRHFVEVEMPLEMPEDKGLLGEETGLTISLMGGADVFRLQEFGYLEVLLQSSFPEKKLRVRNLAWSGDTVYRQQRPMFFYTKDGDSREGSVPDGREKLEPGIFILSFGKLESLDGLDRLSEFEAAYEQLIRGLQKFTKRLILVEPVPFAEVGPAKVLARERNAVLAKYAEGIGALAERNAVKFAEVPDLSDDDFGRTGIHLSASGFFHWSKAVSNAVGARSGGESVGYPSKVPGFLVMSILEKNRLWDQYYRPTNWAFLYGDRQHVPSSRGHKDSNERWFIEELDRLPELIEDKEEEIWNRAKEVAR
ncbi:MAG: hypothetical protein AAGC68_01570 [Verrucomicrobiota bacterium]